MLLWLFVFLLNDKAVPFSLHGSRGVPRSLRRHAKEGIDVSSDSFFLVYTCGKCDTRNAIKVNRIAWERGLVIGKCFGCDARHLLADRTGLTDETNRTKFTNAFDLARSTGKGAKRLTKSDAESLKKAGLEFKSDRLSLVPKPGQEIALLDENGTVLALSSDANTTLPTSIEPEPEPEPEPEAEPHQETTDPLEAPTVILPQDVRPGDVLKLKLQDDRTIHVRVPKNSQPGAILMVEGLVEVRTPLNTTQGDLLTVRLPDGDSVTILLSDSEAQPGALIGVGFPVSILQNSSPQLPPSS